jgi:hypothetical protein
MNAPAEPWNPLASSRTSRKDTSAAFMYTMLYHIGSQLGSPSVYSTAPSEIVTNEASHSATSRLEEYRNVVLGTISA